MLSGPKRLRNCLGFSGVESGHNRVPEPPDKMTGVICAFCVMVNISRHRASDERPLVFGKINIGKSRADSTFPRLDQFSADGD
jgi:hypothetical protein